MYWALSNLFWPYQILFEPYLNIGTYLYKTSHTKVKQSLCKPCLENEQKVSLSVCLVICCGVKL